MSVNVKPPVPLSSHRPRKGLDDSRPHVPILQQSLRFLLKCGPNLHVFMLKSINKLQNGNFDRTWKHLALCY